MKKLLICPGLPRTGTTFLYKQFVAENARFFNPSLNKEMHYLQSCRDLDGYSTTFLQHDDEKIYVDSSPTYINNKSAIDNICSLPKSIDVKIIVGLRHPVDQAFSHYTHDLKAHVSKFESNELNGSFFSSQALRKYFIERLDNHKKLVNRFGLENIFALNYHLDVGSDQLANRLSDFLGVHNLNFKSERINQGMWVPYYSYASDKPIQFVHTGIVRELKPGQLLLINGTDSHIWDNVSELKAVKALLDSSQWTRSLDVSSLEILYNNTSKYDFEKTLELYNLPLEDFSIPASIDTRMPVIDSDTFQQLELSTDLAPHLAAHLNAA